MSLTQLEASALESFRRGEFPPLPIGDERSDWIQVGLAIALYAARLLRSSGPTVDVSEIDLKSDGSPVTELDHQIEENVRAALADFHPEAVIVGEEGGGELPSKGIAVAIDPVDGTWAHISGTGTAATTLAVFTDGKPFLGVVSNPTTGEVAYAVDGGDARLIRLAMLGEADAGCHLPIAGADPSKILVNIQPSLAAQPVVSALHEAWSRKEIQYARSPGGSPVWAMLEAAKGRFCYVNAWSDRPAEAFDLAAGVLLVRAAGGEVVGLDGEPIDAVRHAGPFVAGVHSAARSSVLEILRSAL
jgi:fructose-1,6-bisphosphatase/inositol monophosphatase family enzyme